MKFDVRRFLKLLPVAVIMLYDTVAAQVDYYDEIQPLFNQYCTSCHGDVSGIDLSSYEATMESKGDLYQKKLVFPGAPDVSPLVEKLEPDPQFGARMPLNQKPLSDEQIYLVRQWIEEGANKKAAETGGIIVDKTEHYKLAKNFPNPFDRQTTLRIRSDRRGEYQLKIFDLQGRVLEKRDGRFYVGATHISIGMERYSPGIYLYRVVLDAADLETEILSGRMILVR